MAVAISRPELVRAVSSHRIRGAGSGSCLGIASGTAAAHIIARRLQLGDRSVRRALDALIDIAPSLEGELLALHDSYYVESGKPEGTPFRPLPPFGLTPTRAVVLLTIAGNFTVVWECKQGHDNAVGINYLQKIQLSQIPAMFGAMLAGVDYVCAGAGDPSGFPELLRQLSRYEPTRQTIHVARAPTGHEMSFNPQGFVPENHPDLKCPRFIAIVSTHSQAQQLEAEDTTRPYGFVFEGPSAGGHNAPPADYQRFRGEPPCWQPSDLPDLEALARLREPFWLAGGRGNPEGLKAALAAGAAGVQVGTILAFSEESGMAPALRTAVLTRAWRKELRVATEPLMSPTGFPFKVAQLPGTISEQRVREEREHWACCDLGQLVTPIETRRRAPDGEGAARELVAIQSLCPAEPLETFLRKGGLLARRRGSICLCNALMSTAGYASVRGGGTYFEPPIVTLGDASVSDIRAIQTRTKGLTYPVEAALAYVLEGYDGDLVDFGRRASGAGEDPGARSVAI